MVMQKAGARGHSRVATAGRFSDKRARVVLQQLRVVFGTVKRHYRDVERASGLGGAHVWALAEIAAAPGLRMQELAAALLVHQSTASNLADRLVRLGLINRRQDSVDGRVVRLSMTAKGRKLLGRAPGPAIGVLPDALQKLSPPMLAQLGAALTKLVELMHGDRTARNRPLADI